MPIAKHFKPAVNAETQFARSLRKVARHSSHIVEMHRDGDKIREADMDEQLIQYSKLIEPWARRQAAKMLEKVARKNKTAWNKNSKEIGKLIKEQVAEAHLGRVAASLMDEQVDLIMSLPLRAGLRVQQLAREAAYSGTRASRLSEIILEMDKTGEVSESDADRIARTEVARANSVITQTRAEAAGSTQYLWRNSGDSAVRPAHETLHGHKLDGMVFDWKSPPTLDDGTTGHPGTFPNCRCYPEPFFPKE